MHWKNHRHAARIAHAVAQPRHGLQMHAIARREIVRRLRDADDGPPALQFARRDSVVEETLEIERGHAGIRRVVPPGFGAEFHASMERTARYIRAASVSVTSHGFGSTRRRIATASRAIAMIASAGTVVL